MPSTHPSPRAYHNMQANWRAAKPGTVEVQLRLRDSTCSPLQGEKNRKKKPVRFKIAFNAKTVHSQTTPFPMLQHIFLLLEGPQRGTKKKPIGEKNRSCSMMFNDSL